MKLLCVVPAIDLHGTTGLVPGYWQLFKGLCELGNKVIVTSYTNLGKPVETLWWKTYRPAAIWEASLYRALRTVLSKLLPAVFSKEYTIGEMAPSFKGKVKLWIIRKSFGSKLKRHVAKILEKERDVNAVIFFSLPLNHFVGLPSLIRKKFHIPVIFFDRDLPVSLPQFYSPQVVSSNWYLDVDLSEYDAICVNSLGGTRYLKEMGAKEVHTIYYGVDPSVFSPVNVKKDIDVFFYGHGSALREEWMEKMIKIPSQRLGNLTFAVEGCDWFGKAKPIGRVSLNNLRFICCRSKINLNITRRYHAEVYASSNGRLFELASTGACIVSNPINGLKEWFDVGKEILVVHDEDEACEVYQQLIDDEDRRMKIGQRARERVFKEHTFRHRAEQLLNVIRTLR